MADRRRILGKVLAKISIRHEKSRGDSAERHNPLGIRKPQPGRARPNLLLISEEIFH